MDINTATTLPGIEPSPLPTTREERGRQIAQRGGIRKVGARYAVPSQTPGAESPVYVVDIVDERGEIYDYAVVCRDASTG
jgi:hypothetical protein